MRTILTIFMLATITNCVLSKNNVKSLTESMGQEVIEIGTPIKELPPDLDEEPSAESDEDDVQTTTTLSAGTKKDVKKTTTLTTDTRRKSKESNKTTSTTTQDDEEARIEKELAEIYKDNIDYKSDSSEVEKSSKGQNSIEKEEEVEINKPIARNKPKTFKFQPDLNNKVEVERFRTSVDQISCEKKNRMKGTTMAIVTLPDSASGIVASMIFCIISILSAFVLN